MLVGYSHILKNKKIILASKSQARKQLLMSLGLDFEVMHSTFDENLQKDQFQDPKDYVKATCLGKIQNVLDQINTNQIKWDILIFCDTICEYSNEIIEKPTDPEDAFKILQKLSGNTHSVHTCLHLIYKNIKQEQIVSTHVETTLVTFGNINEKIIKAYAQSQNPYNKAGGYGIQEMGASFVKCINGCHTNVIGLPLNSLCTSLIELIEINDY